MDSQPLPILASTIPLLWIAISIGISLIVAVIRHRCTERQQYWIDNARWVLIPYVALLVGHLSPRLMGLTEINWLNSISIGAGFIGIVAILLTLVLNRADLAQTEVMFTPASHRTTAQLVVGSATKQFHWSFLRGALWETLLRLGYASGTAAYLGIWIGGLVAVLELLLHGRNTVQRLVDITTLLLTSILFFYTRNVWLCWMLHLLIMAFLRPQHAAAAMR